MHIFKDLLLFLINVLNAIPVFCVVCLIIIIITKIRSQDAIVAMSINVWRFIALATLLWP